MSVVAVLDPIASDIDIERRVLGDAGHDVVIIGAKPDRTDPNIKTVAGVLTTDGLVDGPLLDAMPECRIVATYGVGVDNIDVAAAASRGVVVANVPDYCTNEVADHAMALALALDRRILDGDRLVRAGGWGGDSLRPMRRWRGQTFGVVGLGRIGRAVATRAEAFGFRVVGYDPVTPSQELVSYDSLDDLLAEADVLSLHAPLTPGTRGLIDARAIGLMRRGARLINTSRGGLVDLDAVIAALDTGQLGGAALDVFPTEPPDISLLRDRTDVVLTPHIAFLSTDALEEARRSASMAVADALGGRPVSHRVG